MKKTPKPKALWVQVRNKLHGDPEPKKEPRWIPAKSEKRKIDDAKYAVRRRKFLNLNPWCRANIAGCTGHATDVHHTRGRAGSLLLDERFWIPACRRCHDWIRSNVIEARSRALLCAEGLWNVPAR